MCRYLNVIFTMDCEAIAAHSSEGGPESWEACEASISGYCETLSAEGFKPTLFVVPLAAEKCGAALREIESGCGAELALHVHPQDHGYADYLGAFNGELQKKIIGEAADKWSQAIAEKPASFRSGNISANDYTFPALYDLGFRQSSLSVPGRNFTRVKANWKGSPQYAYRTSRANRLIEGDMDFLEVPVTSDWESVMWGGLTPLELRVEMIDARAHGYTIRKNIERQLAEGSVAPVLVVLTHNIFDYANPAEFRRQVLMGIIGEIRSYAESNSLAVRGPTLAEYHRIFDVAKECG